MTRWRQDYVDLTLSLSLSLSLSVSLLYYSTLLSTLSIPLL